MRRRWGYVVAWVVAAILAVAVGVAAVSTVGASIRGRGPLGGAIVRDLDAGQRALVPDPAATMRRDRVTGEFGTFRVGCRGVVAYGLKATADEAAGWQVVSFEPGPDDDVDAAFSNRRRSVDIEVLCNRGEPAVAEIERNTLPDDDRPDDDRPDDDRPDD